MRKLAIAVFVALMLTACSDNQYTDPPLTNGLLRQYEGKTVRTIIYDRSSTEPDELTLLFTDGSVLVLKTRDYLNTSPASKVVPPPQSSDVYFMPGPEGGHIPVIE